MLDKFLHFLRAHGKKKAEGIDDATTVYPNLFFSPCQAHDILRGYETVKARVSPGVWRTDPKIGLLVFIDQLHK